MALVRRVLGTRDVGHAGTLDPFATGLLVVLVGRATRLARFVEQQPKSYLATARLGSTTDTDDGTGQVVARAPADAVPPTQEAVEAAVNRLAGVQRQRPPAFSAKRVGGRRSYALARRGEPVELPEVEVTVYAAECVEYAYPDLRFRVRVSPGTYIRAIGRDLGETLGRGAHLSDLRRESIGALEVVDAVPLERIGPEALMAPLDIVRHLPQIVLDSEACRAAGYGQRPVVSWNGPEGGAPVAAVGPDGRLVAVGEIHAGVFHPRVVLEPAG